MILINKTDVCSPEHVARVEALIRTLNPYITTRSWAILVCAC